MKKRIASLTLAIALVFALAVPASAAARWDQIASCTVSLMFSGSTADCHIGIIGKSGTSMMRVTVYLQRVNANGSYSLVKSWMEEVHSESYILDESVAGCTSGQYRLSFNATVYNSRGVGEGVTGETFSKC